MKGSLVLGEDINPKILQRQARHKNIETTLRYDYASDQMTKEFFNRKQRPQLVNSDRNDLKTFKTGVDVLLPDTCKEETLLYS